MKQQMEDIDVVENEQIKSVKFYLKIIVSVFFSICFLCGFIIFANKNSYSNFNSFFGVFIFFCCLFGLIYIYNFRNLLWNMKYSYDIEPWNNFENKSINEKYKILLLLYEASLDSYEELLDNFDELQKNYNLKNEFIKKLYYTLEECGINPKKFFDEIVANSSGESVIERVIKKYNSEFPYFFIIKKTKDKTVH